VKREIGKKVASGAAWMVLMKFVVRGLGLISTIILARLLIPEDFGLVAIAMIFYELLDILGSFSFDLLLIQKQNAKRQHYDTAWTLNVFQGFISALILYLIAPTIADFYQEPRLVAIMQLLAVGIFLKGFENIGIVAFRKELELHKEFVFLVSKKVIAASITITIAYIYRSYWALVIGMLASTISGVIFSYLMHPYKPKFSLEKAREVIGFSKWLLLSNILIFFNGKSDDFIVGKMVGTAQLGFYTIAYEISNLPTTELVHPITRAIFPGYSKIASDTDQLQNGFLGVLSIVILLVLPIACGIAITADVLVPLLLGERWLPAVGLIEILALFGITRLFVANTGAVYLALGKPKMLTYLTCGRLAIGLPLMLIGALKYGEYGVAWAVFASGAIMAPINYALLTRLLQLRLRDIIAVVWRPILSSIAMVGVIIVIKNIWIPDGSISSLIVNLVVLVLTGCVVYIGVILLSWRSCGSPKGGELMVIDTLLKRGKR
jgi:O-antigen/teichoic acid export membrane protein